MTLESFIFYTHTNTPLKQPLFLIDIQLAIFNSQQYPAILLHFVLCIMYSYLSIIMIASIKNYAVYVRTVPGINQLLGEQHLARKDTERMITNQFIARKFKSSN